ncbi:MAG TPA: exonuclease SbcCD subunit D [Candidatus Gastranaerophilales bacterium]|nr:exonuclease SbcCD subunit D [Candidatus Gastranaerophilales bacterium]
MKLVHLADLHLGYKAYNKLTSKGLNVRERDVIKAFNEALEKIIEIKPDFIIIAGDIFHKPRPGNTSIYLAIKFLLDFRMKCNAPIIMISGNHEASKSLENENILKIIETTVPGVKVIDRQIEQFTIDNAGISVLGVPYNALCDFEKTTLSPDKNYKYNILTIHGSYESLKCPELDTYGQSSLINPANINQSMWNYVALGHYHKYTKLAENTFYSGAIERTSSNIWQEANEPKGFIEYDLDSGEHKFHQLKSPRKVVDLRKINVDNHTAEEINRKINEEVSKLGALEDLIVRLTLEDIDAVAIRNLDYTQLRFYRKTALHFRLNFLKKGLAGKNSDDTSREGKDLFACFEEELKTYELAAGLNKEKFNDLARNYLYK